MEIFEKRQMRDSVEYQVMIANTDMSDAVARHDNHLHALSEVEWVLEGCEVTDLLSYALLRLNNLVLNSYSRFHISVDCLNCLTIFADKEGRPKALVFA